MSDIQVLSRVEFGDKSVPAFNIGSQVVEGMVHSGTSIVPLTLIPKTKPGAVFSSMPFSTELAGSGTAGTVPRDKALWMAMGFKEAVVAVTSVTYEITGLLADVVTNVAPVDIDLYIGNAFKNACNDAIGTVNMIVTPAQAVELAWSFNGRYEAPTEAAGAAVAATSGASVIAAGLTCTVNTKTLVMKEINIPLNATNNSPNLDIASVKAVAAPKLTGMMPTFTFTVQRPPFSDLDFHSLFIAGTKIALTFVVGATAGNICTVSIDGYMNAVPQEGEIDGVGTQTISCDMSWADADTQLQLVYT